MIPLRASLDHVGLHQGGGECGHEREGSVASDRRALVNGGEELGRRGEDETQVVESSHAPGRIADERVCKVGAEVLHRCECLDATVPTTEFVWGEFVLGAVWTGNAVLGLEAECLDDWHRHSVVGKVEKLGDSGERQCDTAIGAVQELIGEQSTPWVVDGGIETEGFVSDVGGDLKLESGSGRVGLQALLKLGFPERRLDGRDGGVVVAEDGRDEPCTSAQSREIGHALEEARDGGGQRGIRGILPTIDRLDDSSTNQETSVAAPRDGNVHVPCRAV